MIVRPFLGYKPNNTEYLEYMASAEWKAIADTRRAMDKNTCTCCHRKAHDGETLDVHHLTYDRFKHEDVDNDLTTLCRECHDVYHEWKDRYLLELRLEYAKRAEDRAKREGYNKTYNPKHSAWFNRFLLYCHPLDRMFGGTKNMTKWADQEEAYNEFVKSDPQPRGYNGTLKCYKLDVTSYFRDLKIIRINALKRLGYTPWQIHKWFSIDSYTLVQKWYARDIVDGYAMDSINHVRVSKFIGDKIEEEIEIMAKITNFAGYSATQDTERKKLPADQAFVAKIINTKIDENAYGKSIVLQLEITEGDFKGFFKEDFNAQKSGQYEAKYRGTFRLNVPLGDGSERDGWAVNRFNRAMGNIEASNAGYRWDWDSDSLKGKAIGFVTRVCEWNDREYTEIGMLISVDNARAGHFKPMKKREQRVAQPAPAPVVQPVASAWDDATSDEDMPF